MPDGGVCQLRGGGAPLGEQGAAANVEGEDLVEGFVDGGGKGSQVGHYRFSISGFSRKARILRAAVTHSNLHEMAYDRLKVGVIDELITTNSIPVVPRGLPITVLSVAHLLGEAIVRINCNESVTSLFRIKGF